MGITKRNFETHFDKKTLRVVQEALGHVDMDVTGTGPLHRLKYDDECSPACDVCLRMDAADVLQAALLVYADREVREGSVSHKVATDLAAALGDYVDTKFVAEAVPVLKKLGDAARQFNDKLVGGPVPTANEEFERRLKEKRDAIFREIIGKPADLDIWGQPKKEPEAPQARAAQL